MQRKAFYILILFASLAATSARAVTLDWDAVAWTNGVLSTSYDIDPANAGNDITVAVVANGGATLQQHIAAPNPQTPARTTFFQGGLGTAQNTLNIALNLANTSQSVTVNVSFSALYTQGVNNVSFTIFDIDFANASGNTYQDQLTTIRGLSIDGTTLIAPTITTSANNTRTGAGISQIVNGTASTVDTGAGSGNSNVTISFGTNAIRSLTFTYGSSTMFANPTYQHIGIHDLSFTPIPEANPAVMSVLSCMAAAALILRHRARARR